MSLRDPDELAHWKRPEQEVELRALVDELAREQWTTLPPTTIVGTAYGEAVLHRLGAGDGVPALLLPGFGAPALMYRPELVRSITGRPVHLVETIGDVGPSTHTAPIRDADDEAAWVVDVLDGLDLPQAHVVGTSFGAWLALNLALRCPERVASVVAIEPVWQRLGLRTAVRGAPVLLASVAPPLIRERMAHRLHQPLLSDARLRRLGRLAYTGFVNGHPRPEFLTDAQLARIDRPVHVLLGAASEVTAPDAVRDRLRRVLPAARVEIVPDAGHSLPVEHPAEVGQRIDQALRAAEPPLA